MHNLGAGSSIHNNFAATFPRKTTKYFKKLCESLKLKHLKPGQSIFLR